MSEILPTEIKTRETELRVYDLDTDVTRESLIRAGAHLIGIMTLKRVVMDVIPKNDNRWIRLRTDGTKTTLAVKERIDEHADGTGEHEVVVSDFDETLKILQSIGNYSPRSLQETIREEYQLEDSTISIDTWPIIGNILEIESEDLEGIMQTAHKLNIAESNLTSLPVEEYYLQHEGIDVKTTNLTILNGNN